MAEDTNYIVPGSLATVDRFIKRYPEISKRVDPITIEETLIEATAHLEGMTSRWLAPFTNTTDQIMLHGLYPDEYGDDSSGMPIGIQGSLGISFAEAIGADDLVRHFYLNQYAPLYPELWTYSITSMEIFLTYGNSQPIDFHGGGIIGPETNSGHCLVPGNRVLRSDLLWTPIEHIQVGDHLVAFDENATGGQGSNRKYRDSTVEAVDIFDLPCYEVTFSDGTSIVASEDHQWLVKGDPRSGGREIKKIPSADRDPSTRGSYVWRRTDQLRAQDGDFSHPTWGASKVSKPMTTWETDTSNEGGYLAAAFDGEGWANISTEKNTWNGTGFSQRENAMLDRVRDILKEKDFVFSDSLHHKPQPETFTRSTDIHTLNILGGRQETMRLLGSIRPVRLLDKFTPNTQGDFHADKTVTVKTIVPVGNKEVIALQTSSRTYIAEGFAAHNCWLRLGTFAPVGTRLWCTYSGGYTGGIPASLNRACMMQAVLFLVEDGTVVMRDGVNIVDFQESIDRLLAPWMRY